MLAKLESAERLWDRVTNAIYLGSQAWTKRMRKAVESKLRSTDHPKAQRAVGRPAMNEIVSSVARIAKLSPDNVRSRRGGPLRRLVAWIGWHEGLVTLRSIAASLRLRSEGYISNLIRRCEQELNADRILLGVLDQSLALLRA